MSICTYLISSVILTASFRSYIPPPVLASPDSDNKREVSSAVSPQRSPAIQCHFNFQGLVPRLRYWGDLYNGVWGIN